MQCPKCHNQVASNLVYCPYCGEQLLRQPKPSSTATRPAQGRRRRRTKLVNSPKQWSGSTVLIFVISIAVSLIVGDLIGEKSSSRHQSPPQAQVTTGLPSQISTTKPATGQGISSMVALPAPTVHPSKTASSVTAPKIVQNVLVDSHKGWQSTGMKIKQGAKVAIYVTAGQWTYWPGMEPNTSGQGDSSYICEQHDPTTGCTEPLPSFARGALIGKIGTSVFGIGHNVSIRAPKTGVLYLRMNVPGGQSGVIPYSPAGQLKVTVTTQ